MKKPNLNLKTRIKGAATYTKSEVERRIQDYRQERREKLKSHHPRPHQSTRARIAKAGKALPTYEALFKPAPPPVLSPAKYGEDILNTVDEVLSIKNPRRNRK